MAVPPEAYLLVAAIAAVAVVPFVIRLSPYEFLTPRFRVAGIFLVGFCMRPLYILLWPEHAHPYIRNRPDFPELVVDGLILALAGLIILWIGYSVPLGKAIAGLLPVFPQEISPARWRQVVFGCLAVGLLGYLLFLWRLGGIGSLLSILYMRAAVYEADEAAGPLREVVKLIGLSALLGIHYHIAISRSRWAWPLLIFATLVMGTMGSRGPVAALWGGTYLLHAVQVRRYRTWKLFFALILGVAIFASAYLGFRRATRYGVGEAVASVTKLPQEGMELLMESAPAFDHMVAAMVASGRVFPFREGRTYAEVLPIMFPRAIWPYETETAGVTLRKAIEPTGIGGRPSSAMGEGYMNFGIVGALVPMFLLGVWYRLIHIYMLRTVGRSRFGPLLYVLALQSTRRLLTGVLAIVMRERFFRFLVAFVAFFWSARRAGSAEVSTSSSATPSTANGLPA